MIEAYITVTFAGGYVYPTFCQPLESEDVLPDVIASIMDFSSSSPVPISEVSISYCDADGNSVQKIGGYCDEGEAFKDMFREGGGLI